jgi:predicted AAA+ superfamily ATPase
MSEIGNAFSAKRVSDRFGSEGRKVSVDTVLEYLRLCESAFLVSKVPRQDLKGGRILKTDEKCYLADHGVREAVFGSNLRDIGQVLENIVHNELVRRGYRVTIGRVGAKEVDFVADRGGERAYVQVAYLLSGADTEEREFSPLREIRDNHRKIVLSMDPICRGRDGIEHMNVIDFLLGKDK